jgi:hypothetical protein
MTKTLTPKQIAALAAGRAKGKALREAAERGEAPTMQFIKAEPKPEPKAAEPAKAKGLGHTDARLKLRGLGLAAAKLPGRGQTVTIGGFAVSNLKGVFHFVEAKPEAKPAKPAAPEVTREQVLAWLSANGLKL